MAKFLHRAEDFRVLHAPYTALLEEYYGRGGPDLVRGHPYPTTLEEWTGQRETLRRRLIASLGLPGDATGPASARGDLQARVTGQIDRSRDGYVIELVEFQSSPGVYVSATLYRPADQTGTRLPAVFSPHGHWQTGKHSRHIQIRSANLARRGYVALVMDTIGHGERAFMGHRPPAAHALLYAGASLAGLQVWDNVRALDYLCARPDVDAARIGVTGASGGGNHTMYLAAVDERVAVAVPVCSVELLEVYFRKSQCVCETVPDLLTYADKPHLLGLIAPRPLLIMNGMRDPGFSTLSARRAFDRVRRIYRLFPGGDDRLALFETNVEHSYDRAMRERAYAWFDRWLRGTSAEAAGERTTEAATWVEAEEADTLRVWGPLGAGSRPQDAHTLASYYAAIAPPVPASAADAGAGSAPSPVAPVDADRLRRQLVDDAFGGWPEREPLRVDAVDTMTRDDCAIESLVYWSEPGVPVPALLFRPLPAPATAMPAVLYTSAAGKARTPELRAIHEVVRTGAAVLAIDYRGQGETAGTGGAQGEQAAVGRGILLHRPLFAGRVWDVLRGVEYLRARPEVDAGRVYVWGEEAAALLALHAAALDEAIAGAACIGLPASYRAPSDGRDVELADWLVVPGLLRIADVPVLQALVAPRPCLTGTLAGAAELVAGLAAERQRR
jgi:dienelactone hydrolase